MSTSRCSGPARSSGPTGTDVSASATGSSSIRIGTPTPAPRRSRSAHRTGRARDPDRSAAARARAIETLQQNRELVHDEEIWIAFTEQIVLGMGGEPGAARACAAEMVREWERHENFSLYEDALPVLDELRRHEISIGVISNGERGLDEFVEHHALDGDAIVGSKAHGRVKPHASIFVAALQALDAEP